MSGKRRLMRSIDQQYQHDVHERRHVDVAHYARVGYFLSATDGIAAHI